MKFNDITTIKSPAAAARQALYRESIAVNESLRGDRLQEELTRITEEINILASHGGNEYARAVLHREIYRDMAQVDASLYESDLDDGGLEQAEVVIAAKAMNKKLQDMIEDVADMLGSDMITLVNEMKQRFGDASGEQYAQVVKGALEAAIDTLTSSKDSLDSAITSLTSGEAPMGMTDIDAAGADAPIFPSSAGPEDEPTGREMKSDIE